MPHYFQDSARAAVKAATSTVDLVLTDPDIRDGLVGIPHYIHSMIAFACVFLVKVSIQYSNQYIEDAVIFDLTSRAVQQFRATPVGKWHLVHMMAEGLDKMIARQTRVLPAPTTIQRSNGLTQPATLQPLMGLPTSLPPPASTDGLYEENIYSNTFEEGFNFGTSSFLNFDTGVLDLDFPGFGF